MLTIRSPARGAPDGPGALSHFDLARKDCLGTARNTTSKVWYTVAGGVLSDVYYPTVDNTNVETLQYVVTDGSTFTDLQTRDMTYTVAPLDGTGGMACEVTATAKSGKYTIATDYVTDPGRNALLMRVELKPKPSKPPKKAATYQLYVRFDPTVNGNGGGGAGNGGADSATVDTLDRRTRCSSPPTRSRRRTRRTATTRSRSTRRSTARFSQADERLRRHGERRARPARRRRTRSRRRYDDATNGNVVQTAQVALDAGRQDGARARLRRLAGRGRRRRRGLARHGVRQGARRLPEGLEALRRRR